MWSQAAALAKAAALSTVLVPVPLRCQLSENWCYLAVSEMVAEYSGVPLDQCNILRLKNGATSRSSGSPCSCGATGVEGSPSSVTGFESGGDPLFGELDLKCDGSQWGADLGLTADKLEAALHKTPGDRGEPVAVGVSVGGALHIVVLVGLMDSVGGKVAFWLDPLPKCAGDRCGAKCVGYLDRMRKACSRNVAVQWSMLDVWGLGKATGNPCELEPKPADVATNAGRPCPDPAPLDREGTALRELLDTWRARDGGTFGVGESYLDNFWYDHVVAGTKERNPPYDLASAPTLVRQLVKRRDGDRVEVIGIATRSYVSGDAPSAPTGQVWEVCDRKLSPDQLAILTRAGPPPDTITIPELDLTVPVRWETSGKQSFRYDGEWIGQRAFKKRIQLSLPP